MSILSFTLLVWLGSLAAGFLGALTGLGGGVVIVPLLAIVFGVNLRYAVGASLVSVIATSSGAAAAYVRERILQHPSGYVSRDSHQYRRAWRRISGRISSPFNNCHHLWRGSDAFGFHVIPQIHSSDRVCDQIDPIALWLGLNGSYPAGEAIMQYRICRVMGGFLIMICAG